ncbi:MAG: NADH-quinone oxidoreductase subunit J [bacterium]|nr:NADH-quinone oxidoreductase subunit J [Planctomycetota bacterium]
MGDASFYYMALASVVSALLAVTRPNPVHCMLWVLLLFLHVAGIFLLLGAEFLAAVQVIVYAGAILIFYLFVLMLIDVPDEEAGRRLGRHWPLACAAGFSFAALGLLAWVGPLSGMGGARPRMLDPSTPNQANGSAVAEMGRALFGRFALPFEIASLVLLVAIIGAVVLAQKRTERL